MRVSYCISVSALLLFAGNLEALDETAARLNRWEFMFAAAPLPVTGATGSPLNAIATF